MSINELSQHQLSQLSTCVLAMETQVTHEDTVRTLAKPGKDVLAYLTPAHVDMLHALVGMLTELGELGDTIKKHIWYDQPWDDTKQENMVEELGDMKFYHTLMLMQFDISNGEYLRYNNDKLAARYADGYSDQAAKDRADKAKDVVQEDTTNGVWVIYNPTMGLYLGRGDIWLSSVTHPEIYTWETAEAASSYLQRSVHLEGTVIYAEIPEPVEPPPLTQNEVNSLLTEPALKTELEVLREFYDAAIVLNATSAVEASYEQVRHEYQTAYERARRWYKQVAEQAIS